MLDLPSPLLDHATIFNQDQKSTKYNFLNTFHMISDVELHITTKQSGLISFIYSYLYMYRYYAQFVYTRHTYAAALLER